MCELYAFNAKQPRVLNESLKEFYSHSNHHPHGWGLGVINDNNEVQIEKEPLQASHSFYLHERLREPIEANMLLAHIRYATIGNLAYKNCHPFTGTDDSGRRWTLIHNGTIFDYPPLAKYVKKQQGDTDSERIFLHILDLMNHEIQFGNEMTAERRFRILDKMVCEMSTGNKLNLLLYDGENLYAHSNHVHTDGVSSLHYLQEKDAVMISTQPLSRDEWKPFPQTTLLGFHEGEQVFTGTNHRHCYEEDPEQVSKLYRIFADL